MIAIPVEPPITEYLHAKAARQGIPLSGTFELTPLCNMNCRMCYVRMSREQQEAIRPLRTAAQWLELGRQAKEQGLLYLLLTGGEPFLRPDFREILAGLHQMGLLISINSNGTLIDESVVRWLKETPPVRINITLYGASDETYGRLCRNPQGFTQVTRAIRLLGEAGITVKLNCSLTPHNAADLEGIFAFAKEEGLLVQATSYMFPPSAPGPQPGGLQRPLHPPGGGLLRRPDRIPPERGGGLPGAAEIPKLGGTLRRPRGGLRNPGGGGHPVPRRKVQLLGDLGGAPPALWDAPGSGSGRVPGGLCRGLETGEGSRRRNPAAGKMRQL